MRQVFRGFLFISFKIANRFMLACIFIFDASLLFK